MKLAFTTANTISSLLKELEENFPDTIPINNQISLEEFRTLQGQQEVLQFIRNLLDTEEDDE